MTLTAERRALQAVVALTCCIPLLASATGIVRGAAWLQPAAPATDLDSHFRYLSGIFLVMGIAFVASIPSIERQGARLRLMGAMVVTGGVARLWSLATIGMPSTGHVVGLFVELGVVPAVLLWQASLARRWRVSHRPNVIGSRDRDIG